MKITGKVNYIIQELLNLDREKEYQVEIKEPNRSLSQNRYMWELIGKISKKQYQEEIDIYCQCLEEANAKYEYILGLETIESELRKNFRAVKVVRPEIYKGKK